MTRPTTLVVAGVVLDADGRILFGRRPAGKVYAGYWELPGGKVEPGESFEQALARELHEELGIEVERSHPWIVREHDYAHALVQIRFRRVPAWHGGLHGREGQQLSWQVPGAAPLAPMLPANGPILRALSLPPVYAFSNAAELGEAAWLRALDRALAGGLRLLVLREPGWSSDRIEALARAALAAARRHGARMLVHEHADLAARLGADGVHYPARMLGGTLLPRPPGGWCAASCHDAEEIERAFAGGADFVVLGPVMPTASHPGAATLGWTRFAQIAGTSPIPVFALGGMRPDDVETARTNGAHGIAMLRGAWPG